MFEWDRKCIKDGAPCNGQCGHGYCRKVQECLVIYSRQTRRMEQEQEEKKQENLNHAMVSAKIY